MIIIIMSRSTSNSIKGQKPPKDHSPSQPSSLDIMKELKAFRGALSADLELNKKKINEVKAFVKVMDKKSAAEFSQVEYQKQQEQAEPPEAQLTAPGQ